MREQLARLDHEFESAQRDDLEVADPVDLDDAFALDDRTGTAPAPRSLLCLAQPAGRRLAHQQHPADRDGGDDRGDDGQREAGALPPGQIEQESGKTGLRCANSGSLASAMRAPTRPAAKPSPAAPR